ncbi:hypothetical protein bcCo53_001424 (plasmid) [Borrelia coriaceae]|nr:hypothetical protein [Borrelia coriaceae]UPA17246.1 hypothetical protein bcCo53_001424 [Borrelia coriaceae]
MFIILLGINTKVFATYYPTYYHRLADGKSALVLTLYGELTEEKRGQCVVVAENNLDVRINNLRNGLKAYIAIGIMIALCLGILLTLLSVAYTWLTK